MNAELTAENKPACSSSSISAKRMYSDRIAHEDERRVEIFIVFPRVISVKICRFLAVCCEEVGTRIISPQRFKKFLEGEMEAGSECQHGLAVMVIQCTERTIPDLFEQPRGLALEAFRACAP